MFPQSVYFPTTALPDTLYITPYTNSYMFWHSGAIVKELL
jgi:hypothetical protein